MGRITEELVRKRAEHNEGVIHSLEEISLHQNEIEKIEFLNQHCRRLKIIYLQNNVISRIENLNRLHELEYLNLALNSIQVIENLDSCENLKKLDLTVNFIELEALEASLNHLRLCHNLRELYLNGNPCSKFEGYRELVIAWLPQLSSLDGDEISHSERIQARHRLPDLKQRLAEEIEMRQMERASGLSDPITEQSYTPENRLKMYREMAEQKAAKEAESQKPKSRFMDGLDDPFLDAQKRMSEKESEKADGSLPRQRNLGQWEFSIEEDERGNIVVDIAIEKFLSTALLDVDVHPMWFQVKVKDKLILLHFPEEVKSDSVKVQRIQANGHLVLTVPKTSNQSSSSLSSSSLLMSNTRSKSKSSEPISLRASQPASVTASSSVATNFRHIVKKSDEAGFSIQESKSKQLVPPVPDISQIDDSDIPPLE